MMRYIRYILRKPYLILLNRHKLTRTLTKTDFDVVHVNNGGYPGSLAAIGFLIFSYRLTFKKLFFVVNNLAVTRKHPLRIFDGLFDFLVERRVTSFVTASDFAGERLKSVLRTPKVITIPNAVVIDSEYLNQDCANNNFVIGMIGILEKRKGHTFAINAFKEVIAEIPGAVLLIEGEGELHDSLYQLIQDLGLSERVKLVGKEENIWAFYASLDVLLFTSIDNEDMPNVISEAQGLGIPVVSHKIAGTVEQILHDNTGYLIDIGDETMLVRSLQLLNDRKRRVIFSENARKNYRAKFSPEKVIKEYLNLYNY